MKVFYDGETIINVEDGCPSIARLENAGAEELPSNLFGGLERYANKDNTRKVGDNWDFNTQEVLKQAKTEVRFDRDRLLEASDKSQLADMPMSDEKRSEWRRYRQALRDIPAQSGFPLKVIWPQAPGE